MSTTEDQIKKLYSSQLAAQKEQLHQDYMKADAEYAAEKEKAQRATDANLTRTAVEAQKAAVNNAELHNAYGLSSGARAQARLAQENQLQANLTALRTQQQELDADVERQRSLLSQQYQSAIRQAQAENDLAKAEALYKEAQTQQNNLLAQQQAQAENELKAAMLMADAGDYTRLAQIYNLTPAELKILMGETGQSEQQGTGPQATTDDYDDAVRRAVWGTAPAADSSHESSGGGSFGLSANAWYSPWLGIEAETYAQGVERMRASGVSNDLITGLMTEDAWNKAKKGGSSAAAGAYDTYAEYLNSYVQYARSVTNKRAIGHPVTTGTSGMTSQ